MSLNLRELFKERQPQWKGQAPSVDMLKAFADFAQSEIDGLQAEIEFILQDLKTLTEPEKEDKITDMNMTPGAK
jgi:hypothetical protein